MFDLDGTLADTGPDLADSVNFTRAYFDLAPLGAQRIYRNVGRGVEHLIRHSLPIQGAEQFREAMGVFIGYYEAHLLDRTVLFPGVAEVLDEFRSKSRAVVSNKIQRLTEAVVRGLGIGDHFDLVLGGDSAVEKKPDPALVNLALAHFKVPPSLALMIGDGDTDVEAGKRAGVLTCGVTYGLGDQKQLIAARPDLLIDRLIDVRNYIC